MAKRQTLEIKTPTGVRNVVSLAVFSSNGICQNPEVASSFEKIFAPDNLFVISSTVVNVYRSLLIALFKRFRSTHVRTPEVFFKTGTIGEHQSVGSVVSSITPSDNIH